MSYKDWMVKLDEEEKAHKDYRRRAKQVVERYKDEQKRDGSRFNILWSNTKVLESATLSKRPEPSVSRRFKDPDPVARQVAEVIERAIGYSVDVYDFFGHAKITNLDYLLPGMGQMRVRYVPYFEKGEPPAIPVVAGLDDEGVEEYYNGDEKVEPLFDDLGTPYILGEPEDELIYEEVTCENVPFERFRWQPTTSWDLCGWAAIEHYLSIDELKEQYPEDFDKIPLGYTVEGDRTSEEDGKARAKLYEIFDKKNRKVIVYAEGYEKPLSEEDDPLGLEEFYPFPRPMMANVTADSLTPSPDYTFYQDQASELDDITERITKLTQEIKYRGFYDGSFDSLANINNLGDGQFDPVAEWAERFPNGRSLDEVIMAMPIKDLMVVMSSLYDARENVKQTIYEVTGLSDIIRGATKASETLGAQQLKQQNAGIRLTEKLNEVSRFFRDIYRLKAEVMAEHFSAETLSMMTGIQVTPEMQEMMQSDMMRSYAIDIESDSTVAADQALEQQNVTELLGAVTQFMSAMGPMIQAGLPPELGKEMLLFAVRRFKGGRQLEQMIENTLGGQNAGAGANTVPPQVGGAAPQMQIQ